MKKFRNQGSGTYFGPTATIVCDHENNGSLTCLLNNGKTKADEISVEEVDEIHFDQLGFTNDAILAGNIHASSSTRKSSLGYDIEINFDNEQVGCRIEEEKNRYIECKSLD